MAATAYLVHNPFFSGMKGSVRIKLNLLLDAVVLLTNVNSTSPSHFKP
jgi:hypothetical protein